MAQRGAELVGFELTDAIAYANRPDKAARFRPFDPRCSITWRDSPVHRETTGLRRDAHIADDDGHGLTSGCNPQQACGDVRGVGIREWGKTVEGLAQRTLATVGAAHSQARLATDAQAYWQSPHSAGWPARSHWQSGLDDGLWSRMGAEHLAMFHRGALASGFDRPWKRVVDWGCGGGANAVHFAPYADELVGVDVS